MFLNSIPPNFENGSKDPSKHFLSYALELPGCTTPATPATTGRKLATENGIYDFFPFPEAKVDSDPTLERL